MNDASWLDRIAHDLRGPLMPLQAAIYLLRSARNGVPMDAAQHEELLAIIEHQVRRLDSMIGEMGDWSRAQEQRLLGRRTPCDLGQTINMAISAIPGCAIAPRVAPEADGAHVECDQFRLVQAFRILLEHSRARDGETFVDVSRQGPMAQVRIVGQPASPDDAAMTLLLTQPDPAPHDEGLGLRLLVARAIAVAHGGSLDIETSSSSFVLRCDIPIADTSA